MDATLYALAERLDRSLHSTRPENSWFAEVRAKLHAYRTCLLQLASRSDGDDGLFFDLTTTEPRVAHMVDQLRGDCRRLVELTDFALAAIDRPDRSVREVRHAVTELVQRTRRYHSRCTTAVHEAIAVDIGVG